MAEVALIGVATAAATGLAQLVAAQVLDEIKLGRGLEDELQKLRQTFVRIQAFLEDAGYSKDVLKSKLVNVWVQKVKDVAYLADDVMDEYSIEIFRRKMKPKNRLKRLGNFSSTIYRTFSIKNRTVMANKVKGILSMFDELDTEATRIGLSQVDIAVKETSHNGAQLSLTNQRANANASNFVGRKDDLEKLLKFICSPSNSSGVGLSTVAVVGMGGVGKTALTRHLYNDERICAYFGKHKIWICVSQNFDINRLLNEIVELVTLKESKLLNTEAIIIKLQEVLKGKKFLIVFDDVWNNKEDSWSCLKGCLDRLGSALGSVFLINTRSYEVAQAAGASLKLRMKELSSDESWALFHLIVFTNNNPVDPALEEVGRRIIEKCKGVPAAIKVIGSLLQSKQHLHEWQSIERTEWKSPQDPNQNKILPLLLLSFNQLHSPSVKQCFAYCAVIPKGNYMCKSELIGLWLSQGYLRSEKTAQDYLRSEETKLTMEEIGEKNLQILLDNSLLEECLSLEPGIVGYKMHDFVYELAVYVCGIELIKEVNDLREIGSCRHLVLNTTENITTLDVPPDTDLTKLRTLGLKGAFLSWDILDHTRYLRTLKLDQCGIAEVPAKVGLLKHLRFLDMSYNSISTLPDSIGKLYQLQTLILRGCINMVKLPKVVNDLVNLRHISTTAPMFACKGLQRLTNLQSLPCLALNDDVEGWSIDELGDLHELKDEIHIRGLECLKDAEVGKKAVLSGKIGVSKLTLFWAEKRKQNSEGRCDEDVLGGLEPQQELKSLEVQNFNGVRFPIWIMGMAVLAEGQGGNRIQLNCLTTVKLLNCSRCQTLPKLGHLPLLKCLILSGLYVDYIGIEFYGGDDVDMLGLISFRCLEELEISGFRRLMTWMEPPKAAFPCLETLRIIDCDRLNLIPVFEFKSLRNLELRHLSSVKYLDVIKYNLGVTSLIIDMLPNVASLPQELANCKKLLVLNISNCGGLVFLPRGLKSLENLRSCVVPDLQSFPLDTLGDNGEGCSNEFGDEIQIMGLECVKESLDNLQSIIVPNLQSCPRVSLGEDGEGSSTHELGDEIHIMGLERVTESLDNIQSIIVPNLQSCARVSFGEDGEGSGIHELGDEIHIMGPEFVTESLDNLQSIIVPNLQSCPRVSFGEDGEGSGIHELGDEIHIMGPEFVMESLDNLQSIIAPNLQSCPRVSLGEDGEGSSIHELGDVTESLDNLQSIVVPNLQSCPRVSLGEDGEGSNDNGIGDEIHIMDLECVKDKEQAMTIGVSVKKNVSRLILSWLEGREENNCIISDEDVLEGLFEGLDSHQNITSLELRNFMGTRFPVWITRMAVLTEVPTNTWTPLNNLTTIKLLNCYKCRTLPKLGQLPLLECLILNGFDVETIGLDFYGDLTMLPVPFKCLRELEISWFKRLTAWKEPPEEAFPHLETLRIGDCEALKSLPALDIVSLVSLELYRLGNIESLDALGYSSGLTYLTLTDLPKITSLPQDLANCSNLQILKVKILPSLVCFPTGLGSLVNLKEINLRRCGDLKYVAGNLHNLSSSFRVLKNIFYESVRQIPANLVECTSLEKIVILNSQMKGLPANLSRLQRLLELRIVVTSAMHLISVVESAKDVPLLRILDLEIPSGWISPEEQKKMTESLPEMTGFLHLRELRLDGFVSIEILPQQLELLTQITTLTLYKFVVLEELPDWICNLSSLVSLTLEYCNKLKRLPSLQHLTYLSIFRCSLLEERCDKNGGS